MGTMQKERELIHAIRSGDDARLAMLLDSSADRTKVLAATINDRQATDHAIGYGMTLLQFASYRKWSGGDSARLLIARGAKMDLHSACGLGSLDRIAELVSQTSDALHQQVDGYFPVQYAISGGQPSSIECLMKFGDDPNRELRKVAYFGWEDETRDQKYTPWKPIHMASLYGFDAGRVPVAAALADAGAELDATSPLNGFQAIHLVAMPNRVDMIRFLVSRGIDIDSRTAKCDEIVAPDDCDGPISGHDCTPLMVAAAEGFVEATECLLELGADRKAENDQGQRALDFAERRFWNGQPYDEIIALLK